MLSLPDAITACKLSNRYRQILPECAVPNRAGKVSFGAILLKNDLADAV